MQTANFNSLKGGVNVIGYFRSSHGIGETGRLIASSLKKQSIPHALVSADFLADKHSKVDFESEMEPAAKYDINLFCIDIVYFLKFIQQVGLDFIRNRYNIILFFWETNVIPKERVKLFSYFNEVWVASQYNFDIVSKSVSLHVHYLPQPLQLSYNPKEIDKGYFGMSNAFTFLFCFDFFSVFKRKNPMAVVDAFIKAFPSRNDVQLLIKSQNGHHHANVLQSALEKIKGDSRIKWIDESMDQQTRFDLMNACECYVSLHRSEGFGLTMAESMLMEKPVIATNYSGNLDFMDSKNSFLCAYKEVPVGPHHYPYPPESVWADADVNEAARWMEYVFNNYDLAKERANLGKNTILRKHSLENVGANIFDRLKKIEQNFSDSNTNINKPFLGIKIARDLFCYYVRGLIRVVRRRFRNAS